MGDIVDGMFESGMMDMPDPFDHGDDLDDVVEYMSRQGRNGPKRARNGRSSLRCNRCGKTGLNWQQVKGSKWRLHDGREPHVCQTSADGFDDEPI